MLHNRLHKPRRICFGCTGDSRFGNLRILSTLILCFQKKKKKPSLPYFLSSGYKLNAQDGKFTRKQSISEWCLRKFHPAIQNGQNSYSEPGHGVSQFIIKANPKLRSLRSFCFQWITFLLLKKKLRKETREEEGRPFPVYLLVPSWLHTEEKSNISWMPPFSRRTFFFFLINRFLETTPHQLLNRSVSDKVKLMNSKDKGLSPKQRLASLPLRRALRTPPPEQVLVPLPELWDFSAFLSEEKISKTFLKEKSVIQLTFEQHGFELGQSTFFNKYICIL